MGDSSAPFRYDGDTNALEMMDGVGKVLRIQTGCQRHRINESTRYHRHLSPCCPKFRAELVRYTWGGDLLRSGADRGNVSLCRAFQVTARRPRNIFDALRPSGEFVPKPWYCEDECGPLCVWLYLAPQPSDQHVDVAIIGLRATPHNGVTQLVPRQHMARTAYECGQQRALGARQLYCTAVAIDKGAAG